MTDPGLTIMAVSALRRRRRGDAAVTLALLVAIRSRFIRGAAAVLGLAAARLRRRSRSAILQPLGDVELLRALARLVFVLAVINLVISVLVNPWRGDRPSDRFPAIVQDVALIGLFTIVATVLMNEQLLTTSAVGAVVVGFALQDTLGNLFAGLAIQIEKPFRVGHWIAIGDREGQVQEITWRATKLRTKAGQFLIVPNGIMSKEAILNYSEPTIPTRLEIEVGASYLTPPNEVKAAIAEALGQLSAGAGDAAAGRPAARLRRLGADVTACGSGSATTRSSSRRATRSAAASGTPSGAATSRSRSRFRSNTRATSCRSDQKATSCRPRRGWRAIDLFSTLPAEAPPDAVAHGAGAHLRRRRGDRPPGRRPAARCTSC